MRLALTFDDGPSEFTPQILEILKKYGVKATFFVVGKHVRANPEILQQIVDDGHQVGNHSDTHAYLGSLATGMVVSELVECQRAVLFAAGVVPTYFRPPYGNRGPTDVFKIAEEVGLKPVLWDVSTGDWAAESVGEIVEHVEKSNGGVVLMHDGSPEGDKDRSLTVQALEEILKAYQRETFVGLEEVLA